MELIQEMKIKSWRGFPLYVYNGSLYWTGLDELCKIIRQTSDQPITVQKMDEMTELMWDDYIYDKVNDGR